MGADAEVEELPGVAEGDLAVAVDGVVADASDVGVVGCGGVAGIRAQAVADVSGSARGVGGSRCSGGGTCLTRRGMSGDRLPWTWSGWVHLAFVLDAHSRRIVGCRAATSMTTPLVGKQEWDLLSVAAIDVLGAGDGLALAREASERQEFLGHSMVNALENADIVVAGRGGGCFTTVASDAVPFTMLGRLTGLKSFGAWIRIDASQKNLSVIQDALQ